ncbi:MAG: hypothetical protein K0Q52_192 [Microbacterium sp.]|jgi:ABC-type transporter Mla subunit MlaD|nr:hypothetical protein [Microbacterium sp.]
MNPTIDPAVIAVIDAAIEGLRTTEANFAAQVTSLDNALDDARSQGTQATADREELEAARDALYAALGYVPPAPEPEPTPEESPDYDESQP